MYFFKKQKVNTTSFLVRFQPGSQAGDIFDEPFENLSEWTNDHIMEQRSPCSNDFIYNRKDCYVGQQSHQSGWKKPILCFHKQGWTGFVFGWLLFCDLSEYF